MYLDYRAENAVRRSRSDGRSSRFVANAIAASALGIGAVVLLIAGLVGSSAAPTPPPKVTIAPATATPAPSPTTAKSDRTAEVQAIIDLPVGAYVPDRAQAPDDGAVMFLMGASGGVAVDPQTGAVGTVFGGEAFNAGVRRSVVAAGSLWISSWPNSIKECGPACWAQATTYRLNIGTGKVMKAYPATYLVGLSTDGLWLATAGRLDRLDLQTAALAASTPWAGTTEPRVGCGGLWSLAIQSAAVILTGADPATGDAVGNPIVLPSAATYGPVAVESGCWMMSGFDGVSAKSASVFQLSGDTGQTLTKEYQTSVLILDGEFWTYSPGGVLQRLEAATGTPYGSSYRLAYPPPGDDAGLLFASVGRLWMLVGEQLVGFNMSTGAANSNN
jgi:hypothetical protein